MGVIRKYFGSHKPFMGVIRKHFGSHKPRTLMTPKVSATVDDRAGAAPTKGCLRLPGMLGDPTPDGSAGRRRRDVPRADPARGLGLSADVK